ncbi:VOC family protein [Aeromonas salmonicida]|uniref:VOC family protein n=1 Tax=Aeromonas salmonicida TaxID=645 RepID=UPI003A88199E
MAATSARSPPGGTMISHIDHLVLTVSDIERAVAFYSSVLNMEAITFGAGAPGATFWQPEDQSATAWAGAAQPGAGGVGGRLPHHPLAAGTGHRPACQPRGGDSRRARHQERRLRAHRINLLPRPGSESCRDQPLPLSPTTS